MRRGTVWIWAPRKGQEKPATEYFQASSLQLKSGIAQVGPQTGQDRHHQLRAKGPSQARLEVTLYRPVGIKLKPQARLVDWVYNPPPITTSLPACPPPRSLARLRWARPGSWPNCNNKEADHAWSFSNLRRRRYISDPIPRALCWFGFFFPCGCWSDSCIEFHPLIGHSSPTHQAESIDRAAFDTACYGVLGTCSYAQLPPAIRGRCRPRSGRYRSPLLIGSFPVALNGQNGTPHLGNGQSYTPPTPA